VHLETNFDRFVILVNTNWSPAAPANRRRGGAGAGGI
jgi:hypothetical protein